MSDDSYHFTATVSPEIMRERNRIVTETRKGDFWKACPGTGGEYLCCGYQILTPVQGCGMYCSYCILQEYHDSRYQIVYSNFNDLRDEVHRKVRQRTGIVRLGTGEFADSLYLEHRSHACQKVADLLDPYENIVVEFKTKCATVEPLAAIRHPGKVIIGFSMNTQPMIELLEYNTAPLHDRIEAMRRCEAMGFFLALHFDPMVHYEGWEKGYAEVVDRIFSAIRDPAKIAWWSMGGFRTTPGLKATLRSLHRHLPLFSGEMMFGDDGKYRYYRPIRAAFYNHMRECVESRYPETPLYLCMESASVWHDAGMLRRIPAGLPAYLDESAKRMLARAPEASS